MVVARVERLLHENYLSKLRTESTIELIDLREDIEESIFAHFLLLQKVTTFVEENQTLPQEKFARYVRSLDYNEREIINIAVARDFVVELVYPPENNNAVLGLNYQENAEQLPGVMRAVENGSPTIVGPVDLVQGGKGFIFRQPVYVSASPPVGGKQLWGIVSVVADYEEFLRATGLAELGNKFEVLIKSKPDSAEHDSVILGQENIALQDPIKLKFEFPSGYWELQAVPAGGWPAQSPTFIKERLLLLAVAALIVGTVLLVSGLAVRQRRTRRQLAVAINAMGDGFAMFDQNGKLKAFNRKYAEIYEASSSRIKVGASFEDIIRLGVENGQHPDAVGCEEEWIQARLDGFYGPDTEFEQELSNGRYILASDRAMEDGGRVCVRTDVTQLKQALDQAEAASHAKTEFLDTLSHELRTPITVILGLATLGQNIESFGKFKGLRETLEDPETDVEQIKGAVEELLENFNETMKKQERSAQHLHSLVEDMIDFAKAETRKISVVPQVLDIDTLASSVVDQMRLKAEEKGLDLGVSSEGGQVYCDRLRTTQILLNLLGNAIKFTEAGCVELKAYQRNSTAVFEVVDTGPGIPVEVQERVFEAFNQLDASSIRRNSGIGLGLAISRQLALLQNGSLELYSEPGKGSKFVLKLPASNECWFPLRNDPASFKRFTGN